MTSIPQVATTMQHILTTVAERAGDQSGMVQRSDATLTGSVFVQTLVFGLGADPEASLSALTQTAAALGVVVSAEALHQRFGPHAATCLEQVLYAAVRQVVAVAPLLLPILERFSEVVVQDSTQIALPAALAARWAGSGGYADAGEAALKLHVALDLRTGRLRGPTLHDGREADAHATLHRTLPTGAVRLVDLGFFDLTLMADLARQGIWWFSRLQPQTAVQTADGRWWEPADLLAACPDPVQDLAVCLGRDAQVPARLIAVRAPQEVVDQRRRRLRADAGKRGVPVSARSLALAAWSVFVTTIPPALLTPAEAVLLAQARWQIELLFKLWKTHGQIDLVRPVQPWRNLCELYARLLNQIVQHWLLLVSGWDDPARSWVKAAQTIRTFWLALALAFRHADRLVAVITALRACIQAGCRKNRRGKKPCTYQRFLAAGEGDLDYA